MAKYSGVLKREDSETNSLLSSKVKTTITMNGNHIKKVNRLFNKYAATLAPGEANMDIYYFCLRQIRQIDLLI